MKKKIILFHSLQYALRAQQKISYLQYIFGSTKMQQMKKSRLQAILYWLLLLYELAYHHVILVPEEHYFS